MINENICLDSYSSSIGWVGYTYSKNKNIEYDIPMFQSIIKRLLIDVSIYSTLRITDLDEEFIEFWGLSDKQLSCIKTLIDAGIVNSTESLPINNINPEYIDCINYIKFTSYVFDGHIFYTNESRKIYIYPHDEIGVGFILENSNEIPLFLNDVNKALLSYENDCCFIIA